MGQRNFRTGGVSDADKRLFIPDECKFLHSKERTMAVLNQEHWRTLVSVKHYAMHERIQV
jgi:hypothetical protein